MDFIVCDKKGKAADFMQEGLSLRTGNVRDCHCPLGLPYDPHKPFLSDAWDFNINSEHSALPGYTHIHAGNFMDRLIYACTGNYYRAYHAGCFADVLCVKVTYADIVCRGVDFGDSFGLKGNGV